MAEPLFEPPRVFELPLTKGNDLSVDFKHKPVIVDEQGEPVLDAGGNRQYALAPYPPGATVKLVIDTTPAKTVAAAISGFHAIVFADHVEVDDIKSGVPWRVILTYQGGLDRVAARGKTVRRD